MATDSRPLEPERSDLPTEVLEDVLASERRRRLLVRLGQSSGPVVVSDLAAEMSAHEEGTTPESVDDESAGAIERELYDQHLPKLTVTGLVEYDSMRETVRLGDRAVLGRIDRE